MIANLLISKYPNSSPNKRKRPAKNSTLPSTSPTSEQVRREREGNGRKLRLFFCTIFQLLGHLEHFRRSCRHGNGTGTGLYVQIQCNGRCNRRSRTVMTIQRWAIRIEKEEEAEM